MSLDILIQNGLLFDGTGSTPKIGSIAIKGGRIVEIGENIDLLADKVIDARGKWVTPGFIDIHTHYDAEIEAYPGLQESVRHGVTTTVIGNCSLSLAVGPEEDITDLFARVENLPKSVLQKWIKGKVNWKTPSEYYEHLESCALGPNVAAFIGHSNIRMAVLEKYKCFSRTKASISDLKKMTEILNDALNAGFLGLSIDMLQWHRMHGSQYDGASIPSQNATYREYKYLANVLRKRGRILQATPNANKKQSVLLLAWLSGGLMRRSLKVTALAALDFRSNRFLHKIATWLSNTANYILRGNFRFQTLANSFEVWSDGCNTPMFEEFDAGSRLLDLDDVRDRRSLLKSDRFRKQFKKEWDRKFGRSFHRDLNTMTIVDSPVSAHIGQSFGSLALKQNIDATEYFMNLLETYDEKVRWVSTIANDRPKILHQLLNHPFNFPGFSDAGAHNRNMAFQHAHLCLLRDAQKYEDMMSVERAIYRLTGELAVWLGIDTGFIKENTIADICIIDPHRLDSDLSPALERNDPKANGHMRMVTDSGETVTHVIINGKLAKENGQLSHDLDKKKFGRLLRSKLH